MKFLKSKFFILAFSIFISIIFLIIFKPILTAKTLIFPYAIHPFDIAKTYPKTWFYIKTIYYLNLFISNFLIINSIFIFPKSNKPSNTPKSKQLNYIEDESTLNLLIGNDSKNHAEVFIPEKGLYQNILVTGTIGSR